MYVYLIYDGIKKYNIEKKDALYQREDKELEYFYYLHVDRYGDYIYSIFESEGVRSWIAPYFYADDFFLHSDLDNFNSFKEFELKYRKKEWLRYRELFHIFSWDDENELSEQERIIINKYRKYICKSSYGGFYLDRKKAIYEEIRKKALPSYIRERQQTSISDIPSGILESREVTTYL